MKKINFDDSTKKSIFIYSISGIIVSAVAFILFNIGSLLDFVKGFIAILSPFVWGFVFAFILIRFSYFVERNLPNKMSFKVRRVLSSVISILLLIIIIISLVLVVSPQIGESITKLSKIIVNFTVDPKEWVNNFALSSKLPKETVLQLYEWFNTLVNNIWSSLQNAIPSIVNATINTVNNLLNFLIGFVIALYILIDREKIILAFKKLIKAYASNEFYKKMKDIYDVSITSFYKFFEGKLLDSLIIGLICFVLMMILDLDFALLISLIVCVTNIIPFFGPFIGAIPSTLILLMVDPVQALIFVILIIILQQIDGNIIGPKILGDYVGLSSLWIMFSILVGGGYFGFFGMLLGVPIFSVIYYLVKEETNKRLNIKKTKKGS